MKILTAEQMREVDRLTTERYGLPGLLLMETAAARVAEAIEAEYGAVVGDAALIFCGPGNNGGDGAALARQLHTRGALVTVLLLGRVEDTKGDARTNFEIARKLAATSGTMHFMEVTDEVQFAEIIEEPYADFLIDAIFGTGLSRPAAGLFERAIHVLNEHRFRTSPGAPLTFCPKISIDLPSGLNSDASELIGKAVHADLTVTFTAPKLANILPPAADLNGKLIVAPIGSPDALIVEAGSPLNAVDVSTIEDWLWSTHRDAAAHKGDAGKVLLIAGSRGKVGAACLAGEATMRAGAGLVTIATSSSAQMAIAARVTPECMTEALAEDETGKVTAAAASRALQLAGERDVVALGPGLGTPDDELVEFVRQQVTDRRCPVVIDADGLNALVPWVDDLQGTDQHPLILTPHAGEMARLVGKSAKEVAEKRLEIAREFAVRHHVIVVLKGRRTVIAAPDGDVFINPTGNAGMATGGSGDVLTGVIAGLLAQNPDDAIGATIAGVYLHGLAGDIAASQTGTRALLASDISAHLGAAFIDAGGDVEKP